jgi:hypothetical protein
MTLRRRWKTHRTCVRIDSIRFAVVARGASTRPAKSGSSTCCVATILDVYETLKDFERGARDRSVWSDGRLKERFRWPHRRVRARQDQEAPIWLGGWPA